MTVAVSGVLRGRLPWLIAALLFGTVWVQAITSSRSVGMAAIVVYTAAPVLALSLTIAASLRGRRWVEVGALMLAITPTVLSSVASSERHGAIAVFAACGAMWFVRASRPDRPRRRVVLIVTAFSAASAAIALWVTSGAVREGVSPPWTAITTRTGDLVRAAILVVGEQGFPIPDTAQLAWWGGLGMLIGAALFSDQGRLAGLLPAVVVVLTVGIWAIERWRGPVAATGGVWLVSASVAYLGAALRLDRLPAVRLGRVLIVTAGGVWAAALAQQVKVAAADPVVRGGDWEFWNDWQIETTSVSPVLLLALAVALPFGLVAVLWAMTATPRQPRGVNILGYFDSSSGLGERARELADVLRAGGVRVSEWNIDNAASPLADRSTAPGDDTVFDTTIAVVTAAQLPAVAASHGQLITGTRRLIGYWFWELAEVPDDHRAAIDLVDEIWAPTRFIRDAYRRATHKPVRLAPLPIPEPMSGSPGDDDSGFEPGRFTFLVSFDHLSVMERKNPIGAIESFRLAFPVGDEPVALMVKSINGGQRPEASSRLEAAGSHDRRVTILDEHLPHARHMALIDGADALVTLHRSEGLGLHAADAMWLGTPVIATRYSGSLDLMDDDCAALVDATLIPVTNGDGAYPEHSTWADPDLDQAAVFMQRMVTDTAWASSLASRARRRMETQPSGPEAGRDLARLLAGRPLGRMARPSDDAERVASGSIA